jgi:hypothetical protein
MFMVRGLLSLEPVLCEPFADWLVEELEYCPGDEDGYEEDRYRHHYVLPCKVISVSETETSVWYYTEFVYSV